MRPASSRILIAALAVFACSPAVVAAEGSWTGFNAGVDLGLGQYESSTIDVDYNWYGGTQTTKRTGGIVGLRGGYDHQFGSLVVGGEIDWTYAHISDNWGYSGNVRIANELNWLASARARCGVAIDRSLIYFAAGIAKGDIKHKFDVQAPGNLNDSFSAKNNKLGELLAIGLEHQVTDRVTIRAEMASYTFDGAQATDSRTPSNHWKFNDKISTITVGASYRF